MMRPSPRGVFRLDSWRFFQDSRPILARFSPDSHQILDIHPPFSSVMEVVASDGGDSESGVRPITWMQESPKDSFKVVRDARSGLRHGWPGDGRRTPGRQGPSGAGKRREKAGKGGRGRARVGLPNPTARQLPRNAQRNARRGVRWKKLNGGHDVTGVLDIT